MGSPFQVDAGVPFEARYTLGMDEVEASGGARSEALPLLHRCEAVA
jgi:hypothetical protein